VFDMQGAEARGGMLGANANGEDNPGLFGNGFAYKPYIG
jgi:hypothetical protein